MVAQRLTPPYRRPRLYAASLLQEARRLRLIEGRVLTAADRGAKIRMSIDRYGVVLEKSEENKCICQEFRKQIVDPNFKGYCHCYLYYKEK